MFPQFILVFPIRLISIQFVFSFIKLPLSLPTSIFFSFLLSSLRFFHLQISIHSQFPPVPFFHSHSLFSISSLTAPISGYRLFFLLLHRNLHPPLRHLLFLLRILPYTSLSYLQTFCRFSCLLPLPLRSHSHFIPSLIFIPSFSFTRILPHIYSPLAFPFLLSQSRRFLITILFLRTLHAASSLMFLDALY